MLEKNLIYEIETNKFLLSCIIENLDKFNKIKSPSLLQYMKLVDDLNNILTEEK